MEQQPCSEETTPPWIAQVQAFPGRPFFSALDLDWSRSVSDETNSPICYIHYKEVGKFLAGESARGEGVEFWQASHRKNPLGSLAQPKATSYLQMTRYWCEYGKEDSRNSSKRREAGKRNRASNKRGCLCHFSIKQFYKWPAFAQISYYHREHTDKAGAPCHGRLDPTGGKSVFPQRLSPAIRHWVIHMIHQGFTVEQIFKQHREMVDRAKAAGAPERRDDFMSKQDIHNLLRKFGVSTCRQEHEKDGGRVRAWNNMPAGFRSPEPEGPGCSGSDSGGNVWNEEPEPEYHHESPAVETLGAGGGGVSVIVTPRFTKEYLREVMMRLLHDTPDDPVFISFVCERMEAMTRELEAAKANQLECEQERMNGIRRAPSPDGERAGSRIQKKTRQKK